MTAMNNQHPIQPSPELVNQCMKMHNVGSSLGAICIIAAQWGADQELEACCEWLDAGLRTPYVAIRLRSDRRSKPPSLKEQALEVVTGLEKRWDLQCDLACLRRALETLDDN